MKKGINILVAASCTMISGAAFAQSDKQLTNYNPGRRFISLDMTWKFNEARSKYRGTGAGKEQKARL